jgi:hypothetical protein
MGRYLEQSASAFLEMQQQLQQQTRNLFTNFPFPNFGGVAPQNPEAPSSGSDKGDKGEGNR